MKKLACKLFGHKFEAFNTFTFDIANNNTVTVDISRCPRCGRIEMYVTVLVNVGDDVTFPKCSAKGKYKINLTPHKN